MGRLVERGGVPDVVADLGQCADAFPQYKGFQIADSRFQIHALPAAVFKPACEGCSLFEICSPKGASEGNRAERLARQLFQA